MAFTYETTGDVSLSAIVAIIFGWLRRNTLWLLLGAAAGAGTSYYLNEARPKEYTSALIGFANNLNDLRVRELIQHLQLLRATGDISELAKKLSLTEAEASEIVAIVASPNNTLESDLPPFPARVTTVFHYSIAATVLNPALFPKIEKGIVAYVDNIATVKTHLDQLRQSTARRIAKEKEEIIFLESAKKMLLEGKSQVLDIGSVSRHIADITEKMEDNALYLQRLEHELILTRPMEIVRKPSSPGHYRALAFGAAIGFFSVLAFMVVLGLWRFSKQSA